MALRARTEWTCLSPSVAERLLAGSVVNQKYTCHLHFDSIKNSDFTWRTASRGHEVGASASAPQDDSSARAPNLPGNLGRIGPGMHGTTGRHILDSDGTTTLMAAARDRNIWAVGEVLDKQPNMLHLRDRFGRTALHFAAAGGKKDIVSCLIASGADPDLQEPVGGLSPLMFAVLNGCQDCAQLLLTKGADPNLKDKSGRTALDHARDVGIELRLDAPRAAVPVDDKVRNNKADLMRAAKAGNRLEVDRFLGLRMIGALPGQIDQTDERGFTALMYAAAAGNLEIVTMLITMGSDPFRTNGEGEDAASLARRNGFVKIAQDLIARQSDPRDPVEALCSAAAAGDEEQVSEFLARGWLDQRNLAGQTALTLAATNGHEGCMRLLRDAGADVELKDDLRGENALMRAAAYGHTGIVESLLEAGADPNSQVSPVEPPSWPFSDIAARNSGDQIELDASDFGDDSDMDPSGPA